jgi:hypothetical protein
MPMVLLHIVTGCGRQRLAGNGAKPSFTDQWHQKRGSRFPPVIWIVHFCQFKMRWICEYTRKAELYEQVQVSRPIDYSSIQHVQVQGLLQKAPTSSVSIGNIIRRLAGHWWNR